VSDKDIGNHLANERTFLAWTRTSISVIVFGFVVAKFGITLRQLLQLRPASVLGGASAAGSGAALHQSSVSVAIGVGFMAMAVVMALVSLVRYRQTMRRIETGEFRPARAIVFFVGAATVLFGLILGIYLIVTAGRL
jgi:putative membrane protein